MSRYGFIRWTLHIVNIVAIIWAIVSVELTLSWNSIRGVSNPQSLKTTGQLIPLSISILGLLRLFHAISVQRSEVKFTGIVAVRITCSLALFAQCADI